VRLIVGIGTLNRHVLIDAHIQTQIYCKLQQPVMKSCGFIFQNRLVPLELCCKASVSALGQLRVSAIS
jgi:hypothetical protein